MLQHRIAFKKMMVSERTQTPKDKYCMNPCAIPWVVKVIETEWWLPGTRGWGDGDGELLFNGYRI